MLNKTVVLTVLAVAAAAALALQRTSTRRTPQLENDSVKV
jgi:HAMP domain-containing protein